MAGDESIEQVGSRIRNVVLRLPRDHPVEASLCVSHADPIQAAWVLFDGRPQTEREIYRKSVQSAGILEVDVNSAQIATLHYRSAPKLS